MKKGLIFLLGTITGCLLTVGGLYIIGSSQNELKMDNVTYSEQPIVFTDATRFEIFQVLEDGALARCEDFAYGASSFTGPIVYLVSDGQKLYYDEQILSVPKGKKAMQIGTYKYQSQLGVKTVPVLKIQ